VILVTSGFIGILQRNWCRIGNYVYIYAYIVILDGLVVIMLVIGPKVCRSKPGRGLWIFKDDIKIRSTTSSERKWSRWPHIVRFYGKLKNLAEYESDVSSENFTATFRQICTDSLLGVCAGIFQRTLVDESDMIKTQIETQTDQKMAAAHGSLCTTPHRNSNQ
jgi:hypothetical protein